MKNYEAVLVFNPELSEEEVKEQLSSIEKIISQDGNELTKKEIWGRRRLVYEMGKLREGIYVLVQFSLQRPAIIKELEDYLRQNEAVLRHLIVKLEPKKKAAKAPEPKAEPAAPSQQEGQRDKEPEQASKSENT